MYAFGRWDEEAVIKWLAVGMCLVFLGMVVMPVVSVGKLTYYYTQSGILPNDPLTLAVWNSVIGVNAALIAAAVGGPVGFAISLAAGVALPL